MLNGIVKVWVISQACWQNNEEIGSQRDREVKEIWFQPTVSLKSQRF